MTLEQTRKCPLCGAKETGKTFPYSTQFDGVHFSYLQCGSCLSVFVDPVPDRKTFARMYAKADYHDCYYVGKEVGVYIESVRLLKQYLPAGALVLDYGCGIGAFLKALGTEGFIPVGVEFDKDAADFAGQHACCSTLSVDDFTAQSDKLKFDAIHMGDVLEHLPDPAGTLRELLEYLKPGGMLFVEGPLEINPSPVYWAARLFGAIKRIVLPNFTVTHPPTHLFRTGAEQQLAFFSRVEPCLSLRYQCIYETGFPYASGGKLKRVIAGLAIRLGGKRLFGVTFGNRFKAILVKVCKQT